MKSSTAVISGIAALALLGGGTAYALTSSEPAPVATPVATATTTPTPSADPSPEPTPAETSAAPVELTAEQQTCREYVASKWQNEVYPVEHETDWATAPGSDGQTIVTWTLAGRETERVSPEGTVTMPTDPSHFTCTIASDGSLVGVTVG